MPSTASLDGLSEAAAAYVEMFQAGRLTRRRLSEGIRKSEGVGCMELVEALNWIDTHDSKSLRVPGDSLASANVYRIEQARLKRELRMGLLPLDDVLTADCMKRMRLFDVLRCLPTHRLVRGDDLAGELVERLGVAPLIRVGDLTARQRGVLTSAYQLRIPGVCAPASPALAPLQAPHPFNSKEG
jgi:hypothetical protein